MRVHKFYQKPEQMKPSRNIEKDYELYAITNRNKLAKRFIEERDMDKFIYICDKDWDKIEYRDFINRGQNRGCVLDTYEVLTILDKVPVKENSKVVDILMTYYEYQIVSDSPLEIDDEDLWISGMTNPFIFDKKYLKALQDFEYVAYYKLMVLGAMDNPSKTKKNMKHTDRISYLHLDELGADDYDAPNLQIDQLSVFIKLYGDLLKHK